MYITDPLTVYDYSHVPRLPVVRDDQNSGRTTSYVHCGRPLDNQLIHLKELKNEIIETCRVPTPPIFPIMIILSHYSFQLAGHERLS